MCMQLSTCILPAAVLVWIQTLLHISPGMPVSNSKRQRTTKQQQPGVCQEVSVH